MHEEVMAVDLRAEDHSHVNQKQTNGINGNGMTVANYPQDLLEQELPFVYDGQIPLGDLLARVMQSSYSELAEMAET